MRVVAVHSGERRSPERFRAEEELAYPVALDPEGTVAAGIALKGLPAVVVLDSQGRSAETLVGWNPEEVERTLAVLGAKRAVPLGFAGRWTGGFSLLYGTEVSVEIGDRDGELVLLGSRGFPSGIEPPTGVLQRVEAKLCRASTRTTEKRKKQSEDYWQTWTFRLVSNDRLVIEMRPSRGKPDWSSGQMETVDARRVKK